MGADRVSDQLYDCGFLLVEAFAAMEVTAVVVANTRIAVCLGIPDEYSSYILNAYLYPLFAGMVLALALSGPIARRLDPLGYFLGGLGAFAGGNLLCALAATPAVFFGGRVLMGAGASVAFAGQLWTLSRFHHPRVNRPLVWGEVGAALGVVAGPMVGALFTQAAPEGWRGFFLLNGALALVTAGFAWAGLHGREAAPAPERPRNREAGGVLWTMTAWQVAVSILIVGAEYFFSDHLQTKAGKSPMFVGAMTLLASLGAIAGSLLAVRWERHLERLPSLAALALLASLGVLAACLEGGWFLAAGVPIFTAGLAMGLASVSIYAAIVKASRPEQFLGRSMVYLIGMQVGNALGVQAVGLAEVRHLGVPGTALVLAGLPAVITLGLLFRPAGRTPVGQNLDF